MEETVLKAVDRKVTGKQVRALRREGLLPAVIYGRNFEPVTISLQHREASRLLASITSSHLLTIDVNGVKHTTLVREKQRHPVSGSILHVDFLEVSMTEKLRTSVVIVLTGDAPAVKNYDGVIVPGLESLEIESLPQDLPERIEIDLSSLAEIGDGIYVRDLNLSKKVAILSDENEMIVLVTAQTSDAAFEEESAVAEPEVVERGKKEEEF